MTAAVEYPTSLKMRASVGVCRSNTVPFSRTPCTGGIVPVISDTCDGSVSGTVARTFWYDTPRADNRSMFGVRPRPRRSARSVSMVMKRTLSGFDGAANRPSRDQRYKPAAAATRTRERVMKRRFTTQLWASEQGRTNGVQASASNDADVVETGRRQPGVVVAADLKPHEHRGRKGQAVLPDCCPVHTVSGMKRCDDIPPACQLHPHRCRPGSSRGVCRKSSGGYPALKGQALARGPEHEGVRGIRSNGRPDH